MSLKSIIRKAGLTLGGALLSFNIGCNSLKNQYIDLPARQKSTSLEDKLDSKPYKMKKWQYPVNILGGHFLHTTVHEGSHAITGMLGGAEIKEFRIFPGFDRIGFCYGSVDFKDWGELSLKEKSLMYIAGPVSDVTLSEIINYNLRNGKVLEKNQSFWATTSLLSRFTLIYNVICELRGGKSDISYFSNNSGVPKEVPISLIALYTVLSSKRMAKEFKVALGKDIYQTREQKSRIDLVPSQNGINLTYTKEF